MDSLHLQQAADSTFSSSWYLQILVSLEGSTTEYTLHSRRVDPWRYAQAPVQTRGFPLSQRRLWRQSVANQLRMIYAEEKDQEHAAGTSGNGENEDAPCMEYLPTFTPKMTQMEVYIPYMENLGMIEQL